ncbi:phospholipase C, phosphocholine-specific [Paraburkholderia sp. USG1]|nr:phospholipase C, phosphocholine-specific [Paraburkholderia sp. USG1]
MVGAGGAALGAVPQSIRRVFSLPANNQTGTIKDIKHVVILMQENRSFDHYFGAMRRVRGFGDLTPIPLASGKSVWYQSDGIREILPFRLDKRVMNAAFIPNLPHTFPDAQAVWNQGSFGYWPKFKKSTSMGYYTREELPFQYALADAFAVCDAYHCSVQAGTTVNRIAFMSGSNCDPDVRGAGVNCDDSNAEILNHRSDAVGKWPIPGFTYSDNPFNWKTIPEVLEEAGVSWKFYQDPNDGWLGAMNGCLAFRSFRTAKAGTSICENGMNLHSIDELANDVQNNSLPSVSWIFPDPQHSEHPAKSTPYRGGAFIERILAALSADSDSWSKTAFFLMFDENDGLFDHVPPPAVPSYNPDGSLAGASTISVDGLYCDANKPKYLDPRDTASGRLRPWGLGPRVPMYIVSPWSKGGWVNSQVFDHTSMGQFLEKRFDVTIPGISAWHRAVCGDLTSAFDFVSPNDPKLPVIPKASDFLSVEAKSAALPAVAPPSTAARLFQERGARYSRALPYELSVNQIRGPDGYVVLEFVNSGRQGVVFHLYDRKHLDKIPRRYTVETGKRLVDDYWNPRKTDNGAYDLWVYAPNGFLRVFQGDVNSIDGAELDIRIAAEMTDPLIKLTVLNVGRQPADIEVFENAYRQGGPRKFRAEPDISAEQTWHVAATGYWYDLTLVAGDFKHRFAGRIETGRPSFSDPAMGLDL